MSRLPVTGGDENTWGDILNNFLEQAHNSDGTLKSSAVQSSIPDASDSAKGIIQLAGDLGGTASSPTVSGLSSKVDSSTLDAHTTSSTSVHGIADTSELETASGAQAKVDSHVNDSTDAHPASAIGFTPAGDISETDTQGAVEGLGSRISIHESSLLGSSVHGVVEHDWGRSDWSSLNPVVITADGAQSFATSIVDGKGRLSGPLSNGSLRVAYLLPNTNWADSEMRSVIWGPATTWATNNAQQGHLHRVREYSPGQWEAIGIWTSVVFGGDYSYLHVASVRWDGTYNSLKQSGGSMTGAQDSSYIDRTLSIINIQRWQFVSWFNQYHAIQPDRFKFITTSDTVTASDFADATFNETNKNLFGIDLNLNKFIIVDDTDTNAVDPTHVGAGIIRPSSGSLQKRWTPFVMATRVIGGDANTVPIEIKRWRLGEPEPDWGEPRVRRGTVTSNGTVPSLALGPGQNALWNAHFYNGSGGDWGNISCHKL